VTRPSLFTIPPHRSFSDALAAGLLARFGGEPTGLARGIVLLPNNRAARAVSDAFVRRSDGGLLLPRLVPIGDPELDERIGGALEPIGEGEGEPIPPAIDPTERLFLLARLVQQHMPGEIDAAEALRLGQDLARTLDQLLIEEVAPARLREFAADLPDLSIHWQHSLERLEIILDQWPALLRERGRIDLAERRNRLLDALERRWRRTPPAGFIVAAGINTTAPAVARLLRRVARLPAGMVVLPGLDRAMPQAEWESLGPHEADPATARRRPSIETHPQFHLKLLLDRMGVAPAEVDLWPWSGRQSALTAADRRRRTAPAVRSRAIANAMAPAFHTAKWQGLPPAERRLTGVRAMELADPAEEAQAIAVALREALEMPARTAALVTPDRGLARRVSAHLRRWGIEADDSAGRPLSEMPAGTLLLAIASAAAEHFAPVPLLALLKHPLVMQGEERLDWLESARTLDLALRGPRPPAGLDGISDYLSDWTGRDGDLRRRAKTWWLEVLPLLRPLERAFAAERPLLGRLTATLRETAGRLGADAVWAGTAGRAAAELLAAVEPAASSGPGRV